MKDLERYFNWPDVHVEHFYVYFIIALCLAAYLVVKSESRYKFELFFISFYLLTGNINKLLTFSIPGFNLLDIQPLRFIYLLLLVFIIRKTILSRNRIEWSGYKSLPWFQVALFGYIFLSIVSVLVNSSEIGQAEVLETIIESLAFLILIFALRLMADNPSYDLIGKCIIIGAVFTSVVSLIQLLIDPYFLRIGDNRMAFGGFMRANGIFDTEYFNSYYLIVAITWTLLTVKNQWIKNILVGLFTLGVITTFQRMSWIILALVLLLYFLYINRLSAGKLIFAGLAICTIALTFASFYYKDIMNSSLVRDRLTNNIEGRQGYYSMVLENIGDKPIFGYGALKDNEVYYANLLRITRNRDRASAKTGDLHSGYFSSLFLYGVPAFVFFTIFVLSSVIYYARSTRENLYFVIPFFVSIIYMVGNLTNTFLFLKYVAVLYAIHIGIGMGLEQHRKKVAY